MKSLRGPRERIYGTNSPWLPVWYQYKSGWVYSKNLEPHEFVAQRSTTQNGAVSKNIFGGITKLKKVELLRLAMEMGVSVDPTARKLHIVESPKKEISAAYKSLSKFIQDDSSNKILNASPLEIKGVSHGEVKASLSYWNHTIPWEIQGWCQCADFDRFESIGS